MAKGKSIIDLTSGVVASVISEIETWADDPWPDHLWPAASEVCKGICDRLKLASPVDRFIDSVEHQMSIEGTPALSVHIGDRPVHRAYMSLVSLLVELQMENEDLAEEMQVLQARLKSDGNN